MVFQRDLETGEFKKYCDSIADFVEKCRKIDSDEERLPNEESDWPEWLKYIYTISIVAGFILFGYVVFRAGRWLSEKLGLA